MTPQELSEYLRTGQDWYLYCRRGIVISSLIAGLCMMLIAIYQIGIISSLPDLPFSLFKSDKIDAGATAYSPMGMSVPDAFLGLVSYSVTALLAAYGGSDRFLTLPLVPLLLGGKVTVDLLQAGRLSWLQWAEYRGFCIWCIIAALATLISFCLAIPEVSQTIRTQFR